MKICGKLRKMIKFMKDWNRRQRRQRRHLLLLLFFHLTAVSVFPSAVPFFQDSFRILWDSFICYLRCSSPQRSLLDYWPEFDSISRQKCICQSKLSVEKTRPVNIQFAIKPPLPPPPTVHPSMVTTSVNAVKWHVLHTYTLGREAAAGV